MVGKYNSEQLLHYVKQYYTSGRMALVGVGVDHDQLVEEGNKFTPFSSASPTEEKAVFHGGELRKNVQGSMTFAAVAVNGPSLASNELLSAGLLQCIMGLGPYVKYSSGSPGSRLGQAAAQATKHPFAVSCLNANYTDGGMFGFSVIAQPKDAASVLSAAYSQFASAAETKISDEELSRAKKQLKSQVAMTMENSDCLLADLAEQALGSSQVLGVEEICQAIDKVSADDVTAFAKQLLSGKGAMAAVGDLSNTPYLDELKK